MTARFPRRRATLVLACLVATVSLLSTVEASGALSTTDTPSVTLTKTISRINLVSGHDQVVEQHPFSLTVSDTQQLQNEQQVTVSWTGAHPTAGLGANPNSPAAAGQEYPVVLLECRGVDSTALPAAQQLRPETCWTTSSTERFADSRGDSNGDQAFPPWRLDRYSTPAERTQIVGAPSPLPADCPVPDTANGETQRYVHFIGADGKDYPYGNGGCAGVPAEASDYSNSIIPSNETYAQTGKDGTGSSQFSVWNEQENASLGCDPSVNCALVAVPILGISCDPDASNLPTADQPPAGDQRAIASAACESTGNVPAGQAAGGNARAAISVTGAYWWSESNWRNRVTVPLHFAPDSVTCSPGSDKSVVSIYGSELMTEAMAQWEPHFCLGSSPFTLKHVQLGEPQAVSLLQNGSAEAAFDSYPPDTGYPTPTVNAPTALTGFAITYQVGDNNAKPFPNLKLTPRLLAKVLTESYSVGSFLTGDYPYLAKNPANLAQDPEFQALNPGIPTSVTAQVASTILFASNQSDLMTALTSYLNADPDARAWLNGAPDPWGMVVNPAYANISLPVSTWPLLDSTIAKAQADPAANPCLYYSPVPYLPLVEAPVLRWGIVTQHVQYSNPNDQVVCNVNTLNPQQSRLGAEPRQASGHQFMLGMTTLADAARFGLPVAQLETHTSADAPVKFTDSTGRTFVGGTQAGLLAAGAQLQPSTTTGTWSLNYANLRSDPAQAAAYPGTMLASTTLATLGLPASDAADYAAYLRYVVSATGQTSGKGIGQLPDGYAPLTSVNGLGDLVSYSNAVADAVAAQNGQLPSLIGSASSVSSGGASPTASPTTAPSNSVKPTSPSSASAPSIAASPTASATAARAADSTATTPADGTVSPSASGASSKPAPSTSPSAQPSGDIPLSLGKTAATTSTAAGLLFPLVALLAVMAGLASIFSRFLRKGRP